MNKIYFLVVILLIIISPRNLFAQENTSPAKQEIFNIEKEFADDARKEGIAAAFYKYAAEDAVASRSVGLLKGREEIKKFYEQRSKNDKLEWTAEFVDVSASGDLGYSYGSYVASIYDAAGKKTEYKGVFHTVWKKQKDGNWRFVWD